MNDGGGEGAKEFDSSASERRNLGSDRFANAIAKIAVAQVCDSVGFHCCHQSAVDTFADVAVRYIHQIGKMGNFYANLAGRSEGNALDVIQGLEDLGSSQGFIGAYDTNRCLATSGIVREITQFISGAEENPFAYKVPTFPYARDQKAKPSFNQIGEMPPDDHIPAWLPAFPDANTNNSHENEENKKMDTDGAIEEPRKLNLHQHMSCNGSVVVPPAVEPGDKNVKGKKAVECNPFLAPPLRFGEKNVSSVVLPPKLVDGLPPRESENYFSIFEPFCPVAESVKSPLKNDYEERREMVSPQVRPTVQFKLKSFKKSSGIPMSLKIGNDDQMSSLFDDNNHKHERKRIQEKILEDPMDIVEESAQL